MISISIDPNPQVRQVCELTGGTFVRRQSDSEVQPTVYLLSRTDADIGSPGKHKYYLTSLPDGYTNEVQHDRRVIPFSGATIQVMR